MKRGADFSGYDSFFLAGEKYTEGEAVQRLKEELGAFKGIHAGFLKSLDRADAFRAERRYIPVYRLSARAEYVWQSAAGRASSSEKSGRPRTYAEHREERKIECLRFRAPERLDPKSWQGEVRPLAAEEQKPLRASLYPGGAISRKDNERELKRAAADYSPDGGARILLSDMNFEVIFVPVLRAVCTYREEEYVCFINLQNGACTLEYPVSARVEKEVDKALQTLREARLCIGFAALFILVFAVLSLIGLLRPETQISATTAAIPFALLLVPLLAFLKSLSYNRARLIGKAGGTGKVSGAAAAALLTIASWGAAAAALVVFAMYAL